LLALAAAAWLAVAAPAHADEDGAGWSTHSPGVVDDVRAGLPFVMVVVVPLCAAEQIACGSGGLGNPANEQVNLYWGAKYGSQRFFDRTDSGFERIDESTARDQPPWIARAVYRRWVSGTAWGLPAGHQVEQVVVLRAAHGAHIDAAVDAFWSLATQGGTVRFRDGSQDRTATIHVAGYAGHNRLMDGKRLPAAPAPGARDPLPSFVFACLSDRFFSAPLRAAGSLPLLTTRAYMAPEGYVVLAAARALGENASPHRLRQAVVGAYAKWHSISSASASRLFAPAPTAAR
jgi:hypothetical protein